MIVKQKYSEKVRFKKNILNDNNEHHESILSDIDCRNVLVCEKSKIDRIHTINRIENFDIIDYFCD